MGQQQTSGFCDHCNEQRLLTKNGVNHILHLLLTLVFGFLTAGLMGIGGLVWLGIWIILSFSSGMSSSRCTVCGTTIRDGQQTRLMIIVAVGAAIIYGVSLIPENSDNTYKDDGSPAVTDLTLESTK